MKSKIDGQKGDTHRDETGTTEDRQEIDQDITEKVRINKHRKRARLIFNLIRNSYCVLKQRSTVLQSWTANLTLIKLLQGRDDLCPGIDMIAVKAEEPEFVVRLQLIANTVAVQ